MNGLDGAHADDATLSADGIAGAGGPAAARGDGLRAGDVVAGRYELRGVLGRGAMGTVFRAFDRLLDEMVALKRLRAELCEDAVALEGLRREVKLARRITHRNVVRTYDLGLADGGAFLTMELVDGRSLQHLLQARGALPVGDVIDLGLQICAGLGAAHEAGVVHRDLKPGNVIVARSGQVVITDFGLAIAPTAASAGSGRLAGTPAYMAPEQVLGQRDVDARADLYALGCMLYELVTGHRCWQGKNALQVARARLQQEPPDPRVWAPQLPVVVWTAISKCLSRKREDRYASAGDLARALAAAQSLIPPAALAQDFGTGASGAFASGGDSAEASNLGLTYVAVLPFADQLEPGRSHVATGLTDDLIARLGAVPLVRCRSLGEVLRLGATDADPVAAGRELGAEFVVAGAVGQQAGQVSVRARLVDVQDGFQLWAQRFDVAPGDLLNVSAAIAAAALESMAVAVSQRSVSALAGDVVVDLYLQARDLLRRKWHVDAAPAARLFDEALALLPDEPRILAGAALAHGRAAFTSGRATPDELDRCRRLALAALERAPELPEAHVALAQVELHASRPAHALAQLRIGLHHAPNAAAVHDLMGRTLAEVGDLDDAAHHLERALALDMTLADARWDLARVLALSGRWAEADTVLAWPAVQASDHIGRLFARARLDTWRPQPHWLDDEKVGPDGPPHLDDFIAILRAAATGRLRDDHCAWLRAEAERMPDRSRRRTITLQVLAEIAARAGWLDVARTALHAALAAGLCDVNWLLHCPALHDLRADADYAATVAGLRARLGT